MGRRMKRSEMIGILSNLIYENMTCYYGDGHCFEYDIILKGLEDAGMLPPLTSPENVGLIFGNEPVTVNDDNMVTGIAIWEPEDE
jgi:hypothetical protein